MLGSRRGCMPLLAAALLLVGTFGWLLGGWLRSGPQAAETAFIVPDGASLNAVAVKLEKEGLVSSAGAFKLRARIFGMGRSIKAGEFKLPAHASMSQILSVIASDNILRRFVTIPEGTTLSMPAAMRGEEQLVPFFSAPSRARAWFGGDHVVAPERPRDLFARYPDQACILNPASDYGKEFTPAEIKRLLAGDFEETTRNVTVSADEQVLLGHPREIPHALIAALGRELGAVASVRGAWLMLAMRAGQQEQSWMLGVDHRGSWDEVTAAIDRACAGGVLKGRLLDVTPLNDSSLSSTLRTGIPVTAAKAGLQ